MARIARTRILSPTAINTYLSCPRKFYLRYIKKLKTKPSIHLIRGSIVHRVLERFAKEWDAHGDQDATQMLLAMFERQWQAADAQLKALGLAEAELIRFQRESRLMLLHFCFWLKRNDMWPPERTEMRLVSKKLGLMGIVDAIYRIGDRALLVDYKTSKRADITADIERQAALYAAMYQDFFGRPPEEVWIHFLAFDQEPVVIQVDDQLIQYARILTQSMHQRTQSSDETDYPCTCGGWCQREFIAG